jgi:hypothetical protein
LLGAAILLSVLVGEPLPAQHVHGQASLAIGLEGNAGTAEFRAAGDGLYGFERAPRTAAERARQEAALQRLRTQGAQLLRFAPDLGCAVTSQDVRVVDERAGHGEVVATYRIACQRPVAGKPIRFGITAAFPGIDRLAVRLVSDTAQVGSTIVRDRGQIVP